MNLEAYVRVSKVGGRSGESFISPEAQSEAIRIWAEAHGHHLTWNDPELDVSGGSMERPIFKRIMERIETGQSDGIIVAKLDRFARTLVGALNTIERLEAHDAVLVSVADNIDLSTATGRAFMRILLVFAELERERITDGLDDAVSRAVRRGVHIAKYVPRGYDKIDQKLVPNDLAPAIREAFLMRAAGHSRTKIARKLDEIAPLPDAGCWTPPMVDRMISMRVYKGEAYRGEKSNPNAHPAIVSVAEWNAAQLAPVMGASRSKQPNLLGGIARCAACRYVLAPTMSGSRDGGKWPSYRCRGRHTAGVCPSPASVNRRKLDEYVEALWRKQMAGEGVVNVTDSETLRAASAVLSEAEDELHAFARNTKARKLLGDDAYDEALAVRATEVREALVALDAATVPASGALDVRSYDDLPTEDRKRVLAASIDAVFVSRAHSRVPIEDRVTILWRGDGPDDLPRRGRSNGAIRPYVAA